MRFHPCLFAALIVLPIVSGSVHAESESLPPCTDRALLSTQGLHVRFLSPRVEIWAEGNGVPGLQTEECRVGTEEYRADNKLHTIPERDLGLIGICNFLVVHQCV